MHIRPILTIDGKDESRYFISCHAEMTANSAKDPNKYDLVLANPGGRYTGRFAPKNLDELEREELEVMAGEPGQFKPKKKVGLKIKVQKQGCEGTEENIIDIFSGEIQAAECDEIHCRIDGSCSQGGMTSKIHPKIWNKKTTITTIVNDLLDDFGYTGKRHIYPYKNKVDDQNPTLDQALDFDAALYEVSQWAQSIYFFDERDEFWFCASTDLRGFSVLRGNVMRGSNASNMVGHCNIVRVYGATVEDINERKTHQKIFAEARALDADIAHYGEMVAPPVFLPNADQKRCQEVADNLLEQYRQYKDTPTVKVSGVAPGLLSKVAYWPWNGSPPPVKCDGEEEPEMWPVLGLVVRRVVDISAEVGFTTMLDVATDFLSVNRPEKADGYDKAMNYYAMYPQLLEDPGVLTKYPGVLIV